MTLHAIRIAAAVAVLASVAPAALTAQRVGGQVSILEKEGARPDDLAEAVVWLEPVAAGAAAPRQGSQIAMKGKQFAPRVVVAAVGGTVDFLNDDPFRHNVFSKSGPADFDLGLYARGQSRSMQVLRAGVYPIFCNVHARMVSYVIAIASPYWVRPGTDGRFVLTGVPAGAYTLRAWHERGGLIARSLTVPVDGDVPLALQLDARAYRFVQHKNKYGGSYTTSGSERY